MTGNQVKVLEDILKKICINNKAAKSSDIFAEFKERTNSEIEFYKFKKELSSIIKCEKIKGYQIRQGRNGGVLKNESVENVTIICTYGKFTGSLPSSKLLDFLKGIKQKQLIEKDRKNG